ncbi:hypothetical protein [Serratia sp. Nf2]|uniref:hypothetical protein n=1 Tax=Serratia sp. Nf2 TaxID=2116540 RepID=UPI000D1728E3|nr:hypothetical protein [Serratia sp. Nf2]PTA76667.1 hypothetical protein C9411_15620 [Serratia sp. Nf2]
MDKELSFKFIIEILSQSDVDIDGHIVTIELTGENATKINEIKNALTAIGFISVLKSPRVGTNKIGFSLQANAWLDGKCPFYQSIDDLWRDVRNNSSLPEIYYLLNGNDFPSDEKKIVCIESYLEWKNVVAKISNYHVDKDCVIFVPNDSGGKELFINMSCSLKDILGQEGCDTNLKNALEFIKVLSIDDAQSPERVSIMRAALLDILGDDDNKNITSLINRSAKFYKRYNELLDLYTKRFSVNKILNELDQKNLEYTSKINEFVSSSQNKAFTIPGALIAIGGLAKASGFLDSALIFIGLLMVYFITKMSNDVHFESYISLKKNLMDAFSRYAKFDEDVEVKYAADKLSSELYCKIDNAKRRLESINSMAKSMLWIALVYLAIKWIFTASS